MNYPNLELRRDVMLSEHSTIGLGGQARWFVECQDPGQVRQALLYARAGKLPVCILGGGSNMLFADRGFDGLVMKLAPNPVRELRLDASGRLTAWAGAVWDEVAAFAVAHGLAGLECLSGIPGSAGATPIQNVGAYGQEVSDTMLAVRVLDRAGLEDLTLPADRCGFGYRTSRFKADWRLRYVILEIVMQLRLDGLARIRYGELERQLDARLGGQPLPPFEPGLRLVRETVLELRRAKSMLLDPDDPDARSLGSFFLNPIIDPARFREMQQDWAAAHPQDPLPAFPDPGGVKIPAAWLIERSGFPKGYRTGGVGLSRKHALAIVNRDGSAAEVVALAQAIIAAVRSRFGLELQPEPEPVGF